MMRLAAVLPFSHFAQRLLLSHWVELELSAIAKLQKLSACDLSNITPV